MLKYTIKLKTNNETMTLRLKGLDEDDIMKQLQKFNYDELVSVELGRVVDTSKHKDVDEFKDRLLLFNQMKTVHYRQVGNVRKVM